METETSRYIISLIISYAEISCIQMKDNFFFQKADKYIIYIRQVLRVLKYT